MASLDHLTIGFKSTASRPDPTNLRPPPLTRVVLSALTSFYFHGVSEYLEDLMAQIDAPLLRVVGITFFNQLALDIQQLPQLVSHAPALIPPQDIAQIQISTDFIKLAFSLTRQHSFLTFQISCRGVDWQISSVVQICNQLSFVLSPIEKLDIDAFESILPVNMDDTQWLELFQSFTAVRTLRISDNMQSLVVSALRGLSGESATQMLPALEKLHIPGYQACKHDDWPFIIARQHSDHPVVVLREWM
jgi:hypothetical protein